MIRIELARRLAQEQGTTLKLAEDFVNSFLEEVGKALERGEKVVFAGFGTFEVRRRGQRQGRNPKTGETITLPEANCPAFRPAKILRQRVNSTAPSCSAVIRKNAPAGESPRQRKARSEK